MPPCLRSGRWALTPPFHPCRRTFARRWFIFCDTFRRLKLSLRPPAYSTRHAALWCPDFPLPTALRHARSDRPPSGMNLSSRNPRASSDRWGILGGYSWSGIFLLSRSGICGDFVAMKAIRFLPLVALIFAGCASMESAQRANAERLLCASGFKVIPATTVERQQSLAALPPYTIVRKLKGDDVHYAYADPVQNLLFTGNQECYAKYQQFVLQQQIANFNMQAAEMRWNASQQWNDWPFWGQGVVPPPRMTPYR